MRDDRPAGDPTAPAVWFCYTPDRKGEHPKAHLRTFQGTLQADGYAGFEQIYAGGKIQEAACWAHVRRKFYDLQAAHKSPVATAALERIAGLYAVESDIRGRSPEERREVVAAKRTLLRNLRTHNAGVDRSGAASVRGLSRGTLRVADSFMIDHTDQ